MDLNALPETPTAKTAKEPRRYMATSRAIRLVEAQDICGAEKCTQRANFDVWLKAMDTEAPPAKKYAVLCAACFQKKIREVFELPENAVLDRRTSEL
jgi:hypothetical protein